MGDNWILACHRPAEANHSDQRAPRRERRLGRRVLSRLLPAAVIITALAGIPAAAQGATGDLLRTITAANPEHCGVNVGLAFDGHDLLVSCVDTTSAAGAIIDYVDPRSGAAVKALTVNGHKGLAALAYDASRKMIWACDNPTGSNSPGSGLEVYLINPRDGSSRKIFTSAGCWDGLAYDAADDTVWTSPDQSDTVYHYSSAGALLGQFSGLTRKLGGHGNSGLAVGGSQLFLSNADGGQIYASPKDLSSPHLAASEPSQHIEDMECDNATFTGKNAMWVIGAFNRTVNAYEIPSGTCGVGGRSAVAPPPPVLGRAVDAAPVSGTIRISLPGGGVSFRPLADAAQLPTGTIVDARAGTLRLVSATGTRRTQSGTFGGAVFRVTQDRSARQRGLTTLTLLEGIGGVPPLSVCSSTSGRASAASASSRILQTLHSHVHGRYRTRGRYSAATVRGTIWDTVERCNGTLTIVDQGTVLVADFARHRTVAVRAGRRYLAAPRAGGR